MLRRFRFNIHESFLEEQLSHTGFALVEFACNDSRVRFLAAREDVGEWITIFADDPGTPLLASGAMHPVMYNAARPRHYVLLVHGESNVDHPGMTKGHYIGYLPILNLLVWIYTR